MTVSALQNECQKCQQMPSLSPPTTLSISQSLMSLTTNEGAAMALLTKDRSQLDEDEKIAIEGLPKLGSDIRAQIRVKESKEFKNTVDKLVQRANASLLVGTSSWKEQFIEAITVSAGDEEGGGDDEEEGEAEEKVPSCGDYVMHFLTIFWKILFAFVPPTDILGGYVAFVVSILVIGVLTAFIGDLASHLGCSVGLKDSVTAIAFVALGTSIPAIGDGYVTFVISILMIGVLTAFIGDLASHLGCTVGLKDAVTAIAFVALGTSVPDTFASKVAAIQDEYADASVGNVTGSNAVNVFLGIGIAWTMAAIYHEFFKPANDPGCPALLKKGHPTCFKFYVDPGSLAYSVTVFCSVALVAIAVMVMRRHKAVGGELGGPIKFKYATSAFFFFLWVVYVFMSSLEAYGVVQGF
ncbi:Sodium/calcium exchanger 2 [Folsomia candida]|uniref:Sodium/calcium exchanger 2 n=1 Tax=Folsomia candida TaxID=158441 RepID=A0A226EPW9_FOLCA|nr:Sodium/calcium exchanger 2 [Folsomia candida]